MNNQMKRAGSKLPPKPSTPTTTKKAANVAGKPIKTSTKTKKGGSSAS